jgi:putative DNA-invertase from lambdoid prophage Rac
MSYRIFTRVSTKLQTVENQIQECVRHIDKNKQPDDVVIQINEPETSSRIPMEERVKLQEMLQETKKGDHLVIYKLDRLAREGSELVYIYKSLIKKGVTITSIYEPHIDNANIHIYAFLGETERNNIRIRTISGLKRKQANGEKVGTAWYGYKTDETKIQKHQPDCHSYGKPYLLVEDESEAKQVKLMVEWHKKGLSYGDIASKLADMGFTNRKGNPPEKSTVFRVLKRLQQTPSLLPAC